MSNPAKKSRTTSPNLLMWGVLATLFLAFALVGIDLSDSVLFKPMVVLAMGPLLLASVILKVSSEPGRAFTFTTGHLLLAGILAASVLSFAGAINIGFSLKAFGMQACYFFFFIASFEALDSSAAIERAKDVLIAIALIESAAAFVLYYIPQSTGVGVLMAEPECVSTFGSSMFFAGYLATMIPVSLAVWFEDDARSIRRVLALTSLAAMIYLLILTGSRGSWIGALAATTGFGLVRGKSKRAKLVSLVLVAAVVGGAFLIFPDWMARRTSQVFAFNSHSTFARRMYFYRGAWNAFLASPIFGHGIGNYSVVLPKFRAPDYWMIKSEDIVAHAHNEYLETLAETGIVGILALVSFLGWYIVTMARALKRSSSPRATSILYGCLFGIVAILIGDLAEFNLRTPPGILLALFLIALGLRAAEVPGFSLHLPAAGRGRLKYFVVPALSLYFIFLIPSFFNSYEESRLAYQGISAGIHGPSVGQLSFFQRAIELKPTDDEMRIRYANVLMSREDYASASEQCTTILASQPYYPKAHLIRAVAEFELGNEGAADADLQAELATEDEPLTVYYASYFQYREDRPGPELEYITLLLRNGSRSGDTSYVTRALSRFTALEDREATGTSHAILDSLRMAFAADTSIARAIDSCSAHVPASASLP